MISLPKLVRAPQWKKSEIEWPTVFLFFVVMTVYILSTYFAWRSPASLWPLFVLINSLAVYAIFTVMHEASHKNISRKYPRFEYALGVVSSLLYHGAYEQFVSIHLRHHSKVNLKGEDPDLHASGPITFKKLMMWGTTLLVYLAFFLKNGMFQKRRQWGIYLPYLFVLSLYMLSAFYGFTLKLLIFWLLPSFLGVILTVYVFDHLPHRPHTDPGKYTNAAFYPRRGIDWLLFMQSHHLVHHLWPSIPWYRYRDCYAQRRAELLTAGSIEK